MAARAGAGAGPGRVAERLALAYLLDHPCGGAAIVGAHTPAQIADSCGAADLRLSMDDRRYPED